ncbi:hypothetical protein, partial [Enterococcus casseliflavus]|uniref:hypothetical protein n=1 Tax=Enterococcus casseliflavus TaxID=37734 RepID=UPI003D130CA6
GNSITTRTSARLSDDGVVSAGGKITLTATDESDVRADAGAVALGIALLGQAGSGGNVNLTLGASVAVNHISAETSATA